MYIFISTGLNTNLREEGIEAGSLIRNKWEKLEIPRKINKHLNGYDVSVGLKSAMKWYISRENVLISFCVSNLTFLETPLPPQFLEARSLLCQTTIFNLDGVRVMLLQTYTDHVDVLKANIWIHEDGEWVIKRNQKRRLKLEKDELLKVGWLKMGCLPLLACLSSNLTDSRLERFILFYWSSHKENVATFLYDPKTEEIKEIRDLLPEHCYEGVVHRSTKRVSELHE